MSGVLSKVLKTHFDKHKDPAPYVTASIPYTFHVIPKKPQDYTFGNNFAALTVYLPLKSTIEEACKAAKQKMDAMKNSLIPVATFQQMHFYTTYFSYMAVNFLSNLAAKKHTLLFSNVPGFVKPITLGGGGEVVKLFALPSGAGNIATCVNIVTLAKQFQFSVVSDESQIEDVPAFVELINEVLRELDLEYKEDEED